MVLVAGCAGVLAVSAAFWPLCPTFSVRRNGWRADRELPLVIHVRDATTGAPIPGAKVRVRHPSPSQRVPFAQGTTVADGRSALTVVAGASGDAYQVRFAWEPDRPRLLGHTERISFTGGFIRVEADGYETEEVPLSGDSPITVRLRFVGPGRGVFPSRRQP
jgi:hypothetical protein